MSLIPQNEYVDYSGSIKNGNLLNFFSFMTHCFLTVKFLHCFVVHDVKCIQCFLTNKMLCFNASNSVFFFYVLEEDSDEIKVGTSCKNGGCSKVYVVKFVLCCDFNFEKRV